jgi:hypothetical protein
LLAPYSQVGARVHLSASPDLAAELLHAKSAERLSHVLAGAIGDGELRAGLDVLRRIPGVDVDSILSLALKDVKKSEREVAFQSVGARSSTSAASRRRCVIAPVSSSRMAACVWAGFSICSSRSARRRARPPRGRGHFSASQKPRPRATPSRRSDSLHR